MAQVSSLPPRGVVPFPRRVLAAGVVVLRLIRALFLAYAVAFSVVGTILLVLAGWKTWKLYDSVAGLRSRWPEKTALMRLRESQWTDSGVHVETRWTPVPLSRISENLRKTVLVGEDDKFYQHHGFDMAAIQNALEEAKEKGEMKRGASTITQQLAKNLYLSPKKSLSRKAEEALYTVALEHFLTKDRILELYLNVIEWGKGVYGAEAASETYYGVHAADLNLDQAASLAAVLPKPLKVRPNGNNGFVAFRKAAILQNLRQFKGYGDTLQRDEEDEVEESDVAAVDSVPKVSAPKDSATVAKPIAVTDSVKH